MSDKKKISFEEVVCNAMSEMDYNTLDKVLNLGDGDSWTNEDWEDYSKVAKVIVEPESFTDRDTYEKISQEEMDYYHNLGEDEDYLKQWTYIRNANGEVDGRIEKLCKLISITGY